MRFLKVTLPILLAFIMACFAIASTFVAHHYSNNFIQETTVWSRVISAMTMFIGAYSLLRVHYAKIKRQQKGWGYSGVLYVFFILMVLFGILNYGARKVDDVKAVTFEEAYGVSATTQPSTQPALAEATAQPSTQPALAGASTKPQAGKEVITLTVEGGKPFTDRSGKPLCCTVDSGSKMDKPIRILKDAKDKPLTGAGGKRLYVDLRTGQVTETPPSGFLGPFKPKTTLDEGGKWIYTAVQQPASSTQYSLLGFFICSAAYRTFRAKTPEAAVLLVAALIVMLGQVPIAALIWGKIPVVSQWLLDVPNMAVKRAILFGICVGSVGTSLRVMFGIERSYMGGD